MKTKKRMPDPGSELAVYITNRRRKEFADFNLWRQLHPEARLVVELSWERDFWREKALGK